MKITVLSGSPKGKLSNTIQYSKFIAKFNKNIDFEIFDVGERMNLIEKNEKEFDKIIESIKNADIILWVFPVYHLLVPAQLKRFIELVYEKEKESVFNGKYASSITTSIHFYDNIAHDYINAVSEDLEMKYIKGFTAGMEDLNYKDKQNLLKEYAERIIKIVEDKRNIFKSFKKISEKRKEYRPKNIISKAKKYNYKLLMLTDNTSKEGNLKNMIDTFVKYTENEIEIINLDELKINGGCMGCCRCGYSNQCVYNDELNEFFTNEFLNFDGLIIASTMKDRYLTSQIKRFWDRSFMYGHSFTYNNKGIINNKKILYIISGNLSENSMLKNEIEIRSDINDSYTSDIITDEYFEEKELTEYIEKSSKEFLNAIEKDYKNNENFYSLAAHKIFRDFIYNLRFVFKADHKYYKKTNYYDFPQKKIGLRIVNTLLLQVLKIKFIREEFQNKMKFKMGEKIRNIAEEEVKN